MPTFPVVPAFADYHRTVIGYHGTKRSIASEIVQLKRTFSFSENIDDWLGSGVYFWEFGPQHAWNWAKRRKEKEIQNGTWDEGDDIAVLGSMIRLGHCFDLLDTANIGLLKRHYEEFGRIQSQIGKPLPKNVRSHRALDCEVFEFVYASAKRNGVPVDSSRAVFVPTDKKMRVWKGSWISEASHIQLCVRNPECVLGTWLVPPPR